jgi:hypothetical protein
MGRRGNRNKSKQSHQATVQAKAPNAVPDVPLPAAASDSFPAVPSLAPNNSEAGKRPHHAQAAVTCIQQQSLHFQHSHSQRAIQLCLGPSSTDTHNAHETSHTPGGGGRRRGCALSGTKKVTLRLSYGGTHPFMPHAGLKSAAGPPAKAPLPAGEAADSSQPSE